MIPSFSPERERYRKFVKILSVAKLSVIGSLISIVGIVVSLSFYFIPEDRNTTIENKIEQLEKFKNALSTLDEYVNSQQKTLKKISKEITALNTERGNIQKVLEIDKVKLNALLEYQLTQEKRKTWIGIILSFFIGVLSSSFVAFITVIIQNRKKEDIAKDS